MPRPRPAPPRPVINFTVLNLFYVLPQVMICLLQYFVESLTVVLPYYPTGTMERVVKEGQV